MADENYAIKVSFDGINDAIADFEKLQNAVANIKAPVFNLGGDDSTKIAEASLKKIQLEIDALEEKKAKSAANDLARAEQLAAKQEQSAQRDAQRDADATARKEANAQKVLDQLEKQFASANVQVTQGGNEGPDKEAKFTAQNLQEALRYKQQLAAIDKAGFSAADAANAKELAAGINSLNLQKVEKEFEKVNTGQRNFTGNLKDSAELLGIAAQKVKQFQESASAAFAEQRKSQGALSVQATDAKGLSEALKGLAVELKNQVSTADLTANAAQVAQQGYRGTKENIDLLRASQKLAISEQIDFNQALGLTSTVLKAYNLPASDAAKVTDQLVATARAAKVPVGELGAQYDKLASTVAGTGTSFEQLNSFIANASKQGITAKTSVGALNQALDGLQSGDFVKKASSLGIVLDEQRIKSGGLEEALKQLKAQGIDQNSTALNTLFGSAKNVNAVLPSLQNGLSTVADASGIVNANFDKASGFNKAAASANQLKDALAEVGAVIAPFTLLVTGTLRNVTDGFAKLDPVVKGAIGTIAGLVGAGFAISAVVTGTLAVITPTIGAFKILTGATVQLGVATGVTTGLTAAESAAFGVAGTSATGAAGGIGTATTATTGLGIAAGATALTLGLIVAAAVPLAFIGKTLADAFNTSESVKDLDKLEAKLKQIDAESGKIAENKIDAKPNDKLGNQGSGGFINPFDGTIERQKEVIQFADSQSRYDKILAESGETLKKYGIANLDAASKVKLNSEESKKFTDDIALQSKKLDETINVLKSRAAQSTGNEALQGQINQEIAIFSQRKRLFEDRVKLVEENSKKEIDAIAAVTDEQRKQVEQIKAYQNQDAEKLIKRSFDDGKAKRDRENAAAIDAIEKKNALAKGELDRRQALETEALKEKQTLALQDKQRAFDDTQNAKKIALEDALDAKKRANEDKLNKLKQDFDDRQNALKEQRSEKQRKDDEAFAAQRAARDKQASEALSGAKQLISNEGAIATAKPEDRAKIAAQLEEENRIRAQAATQGIAGAETQEQLVARAKQIAQISAIANGEEQKKVELAIAELDKANKQKQSEIDKAELEKRTEAKRASDREFEAELTDNKRAFDDEQNTAKLNFENTVLKPEKQKIEAELQASKLAFERGELAAVKAQQAADERTLKLQQTNKDLAAKEAADAELETIKLAQKEKELALDRTFEDQKIERERAFKESQRALDKASAIEIQQILGKSAQQIIDAIAITKGGVGAAAAGLVPAFSKGVQNFVGGAALVGERGAELVTLPRGSNVLPANQTKNVLNNSGGNKTYNVNVTTGGGDPTAIALQIQRELQRSAALSS